MKQGDVYHWYFKNDNEYRAKNQSTAYWCMDNKCFVTEDGELVDTYWTGVDATHISSSSSYLNSNRVELEFICNLNDV